MAGRKAKLKYANAPTVTLNNKYNFTKDVTYNGDLEVDPAKLAVTGGVPTYLNYDWNLESDVDIPGDLDVTGDINFVAAQTFEKECTFQEGIVVSALHATIDTGNLVVTAGDITAAAGTVTAGTSITAGTTVVAGTNITATAGSITAPLGNISAGTTVTATTGASVTTGDLEVTAGGVTVTAGNITASAGDIFATAGSITADTTVTAGAGLVATAGGCVVTAGDVTVSNDDVVVTLGDLTVTTGAIAVGTTITAGTALRVIDASAATRALTASAAGELVWAGTQLTNLTELTKTCFTIGVSQATAAGTNQTAYTFAPGVSKLVSFEAILHGLATAGDDTGATPVYKLIGSFTTDGAGAVTALGTITETILFQSTVANHPAFNIFANATDALIRVSNGGAGDNRAITWKGEIYIVNTSLV